MFNRNSIAKNPNRCHCQQHLKMVPDVGTSPNLGPILTQEASITLVPSKRHCQKSKSRPMPESHENGPRCGNVRRLGTIFHTGGFRHPCSTETASIDKNPNRCKCQHNFKMVPDLGTFLNLGPFFTHEASITLVQPKQHCQKSK